MGLDTIKPLDLPSNGPERKKKPLDIITSKFLKEITTKRNGKWKEVTGFEYQGKQISPIYIQRTGNIIEISGLFRTAVQEKEINEDGVLSVLGLDKGKSLSSTMDSIDFEIQLGKSSKDGVSFKILTRELIKQKTVIFATTYSSSGTTIRRTFEVQNTKDYFNDLYQHKLNEFLVYLSQIM